MRAPMPPAEPLFGHARLLAESPLRTLVRWMNDHGPVVRFRVGSREGHVVFGPEGLRRVLGDPDGIYGKDTHGYRTLRLFVGDGLLTSDGAHWAQQRRILQPAFHRQALARYAAVMAEVAARSVDRLARGPAELRVDEEAMRVTLEIVCRALFGADLVSQAAEIGAAVAALQVAANRRITAAFTLPFVVPTAEHLRIRLARRELRRILGHLVDARLRAPRAPSAEPDVIDLLLEAREADTGMPLSRESILDELVTLLVAGHESTANALTWALVLLATHPAEVTAVRAELDAAPGPLGFERLAALPRTRAVVDETLRLYPPAWSFGRAPRRDDEIQGFTVPRGHLVMLVPWATHRDRALFPNPEAFDPTRFLGAAPPPFAYLPFGGGARLCIGHAFARAEAQLVLAAWLGALDFELSAGQDLEPLPLVTLRPRDGVRMRVARRAR